MIVVLAACGTLQPDPTTVSMTIAATGSINPNSAAVPSPVVLRIYQLKSDGAFQTAEFPELFYHDQETLGGELLGRKEFDLKPGVELIYEDRVSPETRYIGVVAGFRDIDRAAWRAIEATVPEGENVLVVNVDSLSVSLRRRKSWGWKLF